MSERGRHMKSCLDYFKEICEIPHGSGNEKALSDYVCSYAKALNLEYIQDEYYNVIIKKPATIGATKKEAIILQGHLDMVCEKLGTCEHNFEKDPIPYYIEDGIMRTEGTTLGADNGTAISYMLRLLESEDVIHPDLECVFTTEEETGLYGAQALEMSGLTGRRLINLDAGPEGYMLVGSAGGGGISVSCKVHWQPLKGKVFRIQLSGLQGGHSGEEINKERANAIVLTGRLLDDLVSNREAHLISLQGGNKDNAIPRECELIVNVPYSSLAACQLWAEDWLETFKKEYGETELTMMIEVEELTDYDRMMSTETTKQVLNWIRLCPNGVIKKNLNFNHLVETSLNLAVVHTTYEKVEFHVSVRSSMLTQQKDLISKLVLLSNVLGMTYELSDTYPAWEHTSHSLLQEICQSVYQERTGQSLEVRTVHGGLECGIFKLKVPELDIVALGCNAGGAHTPEEWLDLESFERVYDYLTEVLKALAV